MALALVRRYAALASPPPYGRLSRIKNLPVPLGAKWRGLKDIRLAVADEFAAFDFIVLHPGHGIALVVLDRLFAVPEIGIRVVRSALREQSFARHYPGFLPIVFLDLAEAEFTSLPTHLTEAFRREPPIEVHHPDWTDAAINAIETRSLEQASFAPEAPVAEKPGPPAPPRRHQAAMFVGLGAVAFLVGGLASAVIGTISNRPLPSRSEMSAAAEAKPVAVTPHAPPTASPDAARPIEVIPELTALDPYPSVPAVIVNAADPITAARTDHAETATGSTESAAAEAKPVAVAPHAPQYASPDTARPIEVIPDLTALDPYPSVPAVIVNAADPITAARTDHAEIATGSTVPVPIPAPKPNIRHRDIRTNAAPSRVGDRLERTRAGKAAKRNAAPVSAEQQRIAVIQKLDISEGEKNWLIVRRAWIGMPASLAKYAWGEPRKISQTTSARGNAEQWVYGPGRDLLFQDSKLGAIE
jgi:hypothetical protein